MSSVTATEGSTATDGMSSTSQGSASTSASETGTTSASTTATTDSTASTDTTAATDSTTTTTTTATTDSTTGEPGPVEFDEACAAVCDKYAQCWQPNPFPDLASCRWLCARDYSPEAPGCVAATIDANLCRVKLSCDALNEFPVVECADLDAEKEALCPAHCEATFVQQSPTACGIGQQCPDAPEELFSCKGDTCSCEVDGVEVSTCPADGVCLGGYPEWAAAANACCGFMI